MKKQALLNIFIIIGFLTSSAFAQQVAPVTLHQKDAGTGSWSFDEFSNGYRVGVIKKANKVPRKGIGSIAGINVAEVCEMTMWIGNLLAVSFNSTLLNGQLQFRGDMYLNRDQNVSIRNNTGLYGSALLTVINDEQAKKVDNYGKSDQGLVRISPFFLNAESDHCADLKRLEEKEVLEHYEQPRSWMSNPTATTAYRHQNVFVVKDTVLKPSMVEATPGYIVGKKTLSVKCGLRTKHCDSLEGRVIKASYKGTLIKSWEIQIAQTGQFGAAVVVMSIPDEKLAKYAILSMASGHPVKVYYEIVESLGAAVTMESYFKDTNILVQGIEQLVAGDISQKETFDVSPVLSDSKLNFDEFLFRNFTNRN